MDLKTKILIYLYLHYDYDAKGITLFGLYDYEASLCAKYIFKQFNLKSFAQDINADPKRYSSYLDYVIEARLFPDNANCIKVINEDIRVRILQSQEDPDVFLNYFITQYNNLLKGNTLQDCDFEFDKAYLSIQSYLLILKKFAELLQIKLPENLNRLCEELYAYIENNWDNLDDETKANILPNVCFYKFDILQDFSQPIQINFMQKPLFIDFKSELQTYLKLYLENHVFDLGIVDDNKRTCLDIFPVVKKATNVLNVNLSKQEFYWKRLNPTTNYGYFKFYYDLQFDNLKAIDLYGNYQYTFNNEYEVYRATEIDLDEESDYYLYSFLKVLQEIGKKRLKNAYNEFKNRFQLNLQVSDLDPDNYDSRNLLFALILFRIFYELGYWQTQYDYKYYEELVTFLKDQIQRFNWVPGLVELGKNTVNLIHMILWLIFNDDAYYKALYKWYYGASENPRLYSFPLKWFLYDTDTMIYYWREAHTKYRIVPNDEGYWYILHVWDTITKLHFITYNCYPYPCSFALHLFKSTFHILYIMCTQNISRYITAITRYGWQLWQWYSAPFSPCIDPWCIPCRGWDDPPRYNGSCPKVCPTPNPGLAYKFYYDVIRLQSNDIKYLFNYTFDAFLDRITDKFPKWLRKYYGIYDNYVDYRILDTFYEHIKTIGRERKYQYLKIQDPRYPNNFFRFTLYNGLMEVWAQCPWEGHLSLVWNYYFKCALEVANNPTPKVFAYYFGVLKVFYKAFYSAYLEFLFNEGQRYLDSIDRLRYAAENLAEAIKRRPW